MDEDRDRGDDRKVCGREIRRGRFESGEGLRRCSTNHTSAHWLHLLSLNFRATKIDGKSRCAWCSSSSRARGPPGAECCGRGGCPWVRTTQRTPSWLLSLLVTPRPTVGRSVLAHSPFHTSHGVLSPRNGLDAPHPGPCGTVGHGQGGSPSSPGPACPDGRTLVSGVCPPPQAHRHFRT